tara:strand:- start:197 stop:778 length:582 start_codon:yes stop_codon:yes gene_type:complete
MNYDEWFPTIIAWSDCPFFEEVKRDIWPLILYQNITMNYDDNGRSYHNWHDDKKFEKLSDWIDSQVKLFYRKHNFHNQYPKCFESWSIDYPEGESNPAHAHTGSVVSINFFLKSNIEDEGTRFKNPVTDMMNPMNLTVNDDWNTQDRLNDWTYNDCSYPPVEGRLLMFRSYLEHYTLSKKIPDKRIILSANYK